MPAEPSGPRAQGDTCLYVIGMHRSGTSATCGLLAHLGLGAPIQGDRMRWGKINERGFWESKSLNLFDQRLLKHLGGSWNSPPRLEPGWEKDPSLDPFRPEAASLFAAAFGPRPIVWKDPRTCILLPFWNEIIGPPLASVFVYRDPFEIAGSLESRNRMRLTHSLASWERHMRYASSGLVGIPTYVLRYESLLSSPEQKTADLIEFLSEVSVVVHDSVVAGAMGHLDESLRHERATTGSRPAVPASVGELMSIFESLEGTHNPWVEPDLGDEPAWVDDTLSMAYETELYRRRYDAMKDSRTMRLARGFTGLRRPKSA
jgi:hypothetical protein